MGEWADYYLEQELARFDYPYWDGWGHDCDWASVSPPKGYAAPELIPAKPEDFPLVR